MVTWLIVNSHSQSSILDILNQISEIKSPVFHDWTVLASELERLGLEKDLIEAEFYFIDKWLKENYTKKTDEDDALPGYSMGSGRERLKKRSSYMSRRFHFKLPPQSRSSPAIRRQRLHPTHLTTAVMKYWMTFLLFLLTMQSKLRRGIEFSNAYMTQRLAHGPGVGFQSTFRRNTKTRISWRTR